MILVEKLLKHNYRLVERYPMLEICLMLISIIALIAVIKPADAFYIEGMNRKGSGMMSDNILGFKNKSNICVSVQCYKTASEVLSKMQPEIKPCDDFYQFACGKFIDEVLIPEDDIATNLFTMTSDIVSNQLKPIIIEERPATDPKHLRLPNILYKACMNTTLIEDLDAAPIKEISDFVGGWPLIKGEAWDSDYKWSWQGMAKKLRKFGFYWDGLFTTTLKVNPSNNTIRILTIDEPTLDLDREFLVQGFSEKMVTDYYDYMVDIAVLFGADKEKAKIELRKVLELEIILAKIPLTFQERVLSIKQLQESYPYVQWLDYVNSLLPEELIVDENEPINVSEPSFFHDLGPVLAMTPKRVIANYMIWKLQHYAVPFLSERFRKRYQQYQTVRMGIEGMKPRWKECVDLTEMSLLISVGSLYVQRYFKEDSKGNTLDMVNNIRSAFEDILKEVAWMDDIMKQKAKERLYSMVAHVGYPDELLDSRKLEGYYRKLEIDPDKYFELILKVNSFRIENTFNKLRLLVNKTDWERHSIPTIVNAFYTYTENSLMLPAGILQGHFFNEQRPKYMNYGAMGFIIGHEITHGFDDEGQTYDKDGNLVDWWQPNAKKVFQEKVTCIREQYGNYTDKSTGLKLKDINTQGENIADDGGNKVAYRAYRKWAAANGPEPSLPGLNYTPQQMFWISAGQVWCEKYRKESLKIAMTTGVHPPSEFRVLGTFSNMKDFSKDFQCPVGSPMNPYHKCEVW